MNLHALLRQRTREAHARLDAALDFRTPGSLTRDRYGQFLRAMLGVVEAMEPVVSARLGWRPPRSRVDCLRADLAALRECRGDSPPRPRVPASEAEAYGCAYVLEGSTLGGLVVASFVSRDLGPRAPTSYLTLRGPDTRDAWLRFVAALQSFGERSDRDAHEAASAMAVDTFAAYAHGMRTAGLPREIA